MFAIWLFESLLAMIYDLSKHEHDNHVYERRLSPPRFALQLFGSAPFMN
jgi:hypothetical protein